MGKDVNYNWVLQLKKFNIKYNNLIKMIIVRNKSKLLLSMNIYKDHCTDPYSHQLCLD